MKNTVVVIDAGGRGAALVHAYAKSPHVSRIIAIPGNDLMSIHSSKPVETYQELKTTSVSEIVAICKKEKETIAFVDVAQDNAVAVGLADALQDEGIPVVGPTKEQGELEWSKAFAREFMKRHTIPQPEFAIFTTVAAGKEYLDNQPEQPWFVKASGLCEGKGALPAGGNKEAKQRIDELQKFGASAETYLLEKWIKSPDGTNAEEFSAFAISDGDSWQLIGFAQDHKRALDGDRGENTGGMGVSTPPLVVTEDIQKQTEDIFEKTFSGMKKEGRPYVGILYLGGILIDGKVYVIEYNARWGDPEAEVLLPGITNDWYEVALAVLDKKLDTLAITTDGKSRVAVAATAKGYPVDYTDARGKEIFGIDQIKNMDHVLLYGAGIKVQNSQEKYVVNGGRILYVIGEGDNVLEARTYAYNAIEKISIEGNNLHYRKDIGWRDVEHLQKK